MPVKDEHKKTLEQHSQGNKFIYSSYDNVTQEMVQEANVIIGNVDPFYLQEAKNLEWLQLNSAGADPYVKKGVLPEDVILTNATGAYGLYFARLMKNFDYHIIGIKRRPGQVPQDIDELHTMDDLDKLLPKADVVLSVLPDSKATRNIFNKDRFEKMKNTSILLNAGRGSAVNTEDLCEALIQGQIYGAGLDVTDPEPLQTQHKLWNVENVIITPHVAGDFHHPATLYRIVDIIAGNLQRYLEGEQLTNIVDTTTGCKL